MFKIILLLVFVFTMETNADVWCDFDIELYSRRPIYRIFSPGNDYILKSMDYLPETVDDEIYGQVLTGG